MTEAVQALGGVKIQAEYPVCVAGAAGTLLVGFIDLLVVRDGEVVSGKRRDGEAAESHPPESNRRPIDYERLWLNSATTT